MRHRQDAAVRELREAPKAVRIGRRKADRRQTGMSVADCVHRREVTRRVVCDERNGRERVERGAIRPVRVEDREQERGSRPEVERDEGRHRRIENDLVAQCIQQGVHIEDQGKAKQCRPEAERREVHHLDRPRLHRARAAHYAGDRPVPQEALLARDQRIGEGFERLRYRPVAQPFAGRGRHADPPWRHRPRRRECRGTHQEGAAGETERDLRGWREALVLVLDHSMYLANVLLWRAADLIGSQPQVQF